MGADRCAAKIFCAVAAKLVQPGAASSPAPLRAACSPSRVARWGRPIRAMRPARHGRRGRQATARSTPCTASRCQIRSGRWRILRARTSAPGSTRRMSARAPISPRCEPAHRFASSSMQSWIIRAHPSRRVMAGAISPTSTTASRISAAMACKTALMGCGERSSTQRRYRGTERSRYPMPFPTGTGPLSPISRRKPVATSRPCAFAKSIAVSIFRTR